MADTASSPSKRLSVREFLEWEERQPRKYELINGLVRMMAGGSRAHNTIKLNILSALRERLRGKPCRPFDSDTKVLTSEGQSYYPDATIDCGTGSDDLTQAVKPTVVFEVLSPSTRRFDLDDKLPRYQATPSIREIVYVASDLMHLMIWRRTAEGWIEDEVVHPEAALELQSMDVRVALSEIYEDVAFDG